MRRASSLSRPRSCWQVHDCTDAVLSVPGTRCSASILSGADPSSPGSSSDRGRTGIPLRQPQSCHALRVSLTLQEVRCDIGARVAHPATEHDAVRLDRDDVVDEEREYDRPRRLRWLDLILELHRLCQVKAVAENRHVAVCELDAFTFRSLGPEPLTGRDHDVDSRVQVALVDLLATELALHS